MGLLIFYILLALGVSFLCSIMEAVLLSISTPFIAQQEQKNPRLGKKLRKFKQNIDLPLAAILSLNTIAHTVGAAGAGAQAAKVFGDVYLGVISAILTFLILVVSEIIPKTLGAAYWRQLTAAVAPLLGLTIWAMWPLVKMAELITRMMAREKTAKSVYRDEFIALADMRVREGVFHQYEARVLQNLFLLRDIRTKDIMTPRTVVFALPEVKTVHQVLQENSRLHFSRIPIYGNGLDDIKGFVLKSEILQTVQSNPDMTLKELCRPLVVVADEMNLHDLFERMMNESAHISLVIDNYGGMEGVVSMEDLLETLLGLEIVDEFDTVEDMQEIARKQWAKRAQRSGLITDALTSTKQKIKSPDPDQSSVTQ